MTDTDKEQQKRPTSTVTVTADFDGQRVDWVLAHMYGGRPRAFFQRAIRDGYVVLNEAPCKPKDHVAENDVIRITWPEESRVELEPDPTLAFDILDEDEAVLVLNKPAGLVVHPAAGNESGTLVHALLAHDEERFTELIDHTLRPGIVHRLDKSTSGVMVVAKTEAARSALKNAFASRTVEKTYLALVKGEFGARSGTVTGAIGRHPKHRTKMAMVSEQQGGKHAVSHYRVIAMNTEYSLLEISIETGRTHQIRVHFADIQHPVIGDGLYGGRQRDISVQPPRQMLHAWKIAFPHPETGKVTQYMAPPPEDFRAALRELGFFVPGEQDTEDR